MCVCAAALVKSWSSTRQSHASRVIFTATSGSLNQPLFPARPAHDFGSDAEIWKVWRGKKNCVFSTHTGV